MLASPLYVHGRGENCGSSQKPTVSGKREAEVIQKRRASAQRTQADHWRRESLKSNSSQEPRASGKLDAVSSRSDEPGNQFEKFVFFFFLKYAAPSKLGRTLLEGSTDHFFSVRQDLNLRSKNIKLDPLIVVSMRFSSKLTLKDWNCRTPVMDIFNLEENKLVYKKNICEEKNLPEMLRSEVCTKWEKWRELKNYELTKS